MATLAVCLGLRWSELVGLKWQDIDWLNGELRLERAVVKQIEDEVKTVHSGKPLALDPRILELLTTQAEQRLRRAGRLGFRLAGKAWTAAPELHVILGKVGTGLSGCRHPTHFAPQLSAHLSFMARRTGDAHHCAATGYAARRHPRNHELWRDRGGRFAGSLSKGCGAGHSAIKARKRHGTAPKLLKNWGGRRESNPQQPEPQSGALPVELLPPDVSIITCFHLSQSPE